MSDDPYREVGMDNPFPGSSADFYEQIQVLKAKVEAGRAEIERMTEQAFKFRDMCFEKDKLITELCEALAESGYYAGTGSLIARAREATRKF